jgi:DNA polymerase III sliding clamp (beta) subunit (PCNA family)
MIKIDQKELLKAVKIIKRIAKGNKENPGFGYVLLTNNTLSGSNLKTNITYISRI